MARLITAGSEDMQFKQDEKSKLPIRACSCVRVNDVLNADPLCVVHGGSAEVQAIITQVDPVTGTVERRYAD